MSPKCWLLASAFLFGSCGVFEADHETVLGAVFFHSNPPSVIIPDTVQAGTPFTVTVRTFGDGCYSFARTEIEMDGMAAEIRPYDSRKTDVACPEILLTIEHTATLRFDTPGLATVRVVGRRTPSEAEDRLEKQVVVR